nr:glycosyltransferase family 4 protein [Holdemania massiliensis]
MTSADIDLSSKGQRFVVRSMGKLKAIGITVTYYLAGNGNQQHLLHEAVKAKVENQIVFLGWLTQEEIFSQIDKVDIYIQPSLQEGLPRAVIEAMSRGCPCIGTNIAGTPELLDKDCIVKTASSNDIVRVIVNMLSKGLEKYAIHNFERSKDYLESTLNGRRNQYFKIIIDELKEIKYGTNDDSSIHN